MNRLPPGLIGAALLFWGWQTESIPLGIALALLLEGAPLAGKRFAIAESAFARMVDVTVVVFVAFVLVRVVTGDPAAGLLGAVRLGPLLLAPLLLAQRLSDAGVVRLSALLIAMRLARDRAELPDPALDFAPFYFAATLLCAGAGNSRSPWFFAAAVALVLGALWFARPRARGAAPWLLLAGAGAAAGYAGQSGLNQLQTRVEAASVELIGDWLQRRDPYRSTTDIGHIGELKQSGAVMLRVHADAGASVPHLFHVASYNAYAQGAWLAKNAPMKPLGVTGGELDLNPGAPGAIATFDVSLPLARGKALLALPPQSTRVAGLRAGNEGAILEANRLGSAQIELPARTLRMRVTAGVAGGLGAPLYGRPDEADLAIPRSELAVIGETAREAGLIGVAPVEAIKRLTRHFGREFSYATYREKPPEGISPIADFLRRTKAGHCEYFATATVLLLRAAGIPARYATGYAVYEYSTRENAYVVRERHAHAWARAFVDGRWRDVDTTPPDWQRIEAERAGLFQPLADWLRFAWHALVELRAEGLAPWVAAGLALILSVIGYRKWKARASRARSPRMRQAEIPAADLRVAFRAVEAAAALYAAPRPAHLPVVAWALAVAPKLRHGVELVDLARAYARARFDPSVNSGEAHAGLTLRCKALALRLREHEGETGT